MLAQWVHTWRAEVCAAQINLMEINARSSIWCWAACSGRGARIGAGNFFDREGPLPPGIYLFSITYEGIIPGYPNDFVKVRCFLVFSIL
jgi:hypothetical protein